MELLAKYVGEKHFGKHVRYKSCKYSDCQKLKLVFTASLMTICCQPLWS